VFIGAMIGVYMATIVDAEGFKKIFNYLLFPIFLLLVLNPKRFITPDPTKAITSPYITFPLYFLIGIYAGFIQAGFGVLFLMIAVMLSKYDLVESNGLKIACVAIYSLAIVLIFQLKGMIIWQAGIAIAIGQMFGGYFAANNLTRFKGANILVYRLLIAIIFLVILRNWGILDVIIGYAI